MLPSPAPVHANENHSICTYQSFDDARLRKSLDAVPIQEWLQRAHGHFLDTVRRLHTLITALHLLVIVAMPLARCCQHSLPATALCSFSKLICIYLGNFPSPQSSSLPPFHSSHMLI